ncbi:MAG TPA: DUF3047 domain-containing protein [Ideonella sp.]|nr:DUF3047 domain-containing protein [Ideonella sp.]
MCGLYRLCAWLQGGKFVVRSVLSQVSMPAARAMQQALALALIPVVLCGCAAPGSRQAVVAEPAKQAEPSRSAALTGWEVVRLPGKRATAYERDVKEGQRCWMADADQSASMYRKRLFVPAAGLGEIEFSWWVDTLVPGADLSAPGQGDAPARLVLAFDGDHGRLSMRNRMLFELADTLSGERPPYATLMYVWANQGGPDTVILNPRTDRVRKIVLESGPAHLKQWRHYRRDVAADFRRAFGEEPGPLIGLAMMTDTDNMGASAQTWYGDVHLGAAGMASPAVPAAKPATSLR